MAHLLLLEVPGGNDFDVLEQACADGHRVSFVTGDLAHYQDGALRAQALTRAVRILEVRPFSYEALEQQVLALHAKDPVQGLLCLIDIRIPEAARLAQRLGVRFLNPRTAAALRDKFTVRSMLAARGIPQPPFRLAQNNRELRAAVEALGLPVVVKPSDGYGSQNVACFLTEDDLNPAIDPLDTYFPWVNDYGLGVQANGRLLVERHLQGRLVGCDTFTRDGRHRLLGINEKLLFDAPSCAIRGSVFPSTRFDEERIAGFVFAVLDALGFDQGAAHTELVVGREGPQLVEVNPRLVGARIPRLLNAALGRSVHRELIALHLGESDRATAEPVARRVAVTRWITAQACGTLAGIQLPSVLPPEIQPVELLKFPGDPVCAPFENADRLGCILAVADTRERAEHIAEDYLAQVKVTLRKAP